jgi:hypothetical protein
MVCLRERYPPADRRSNMQPYFPRAVARVTVIEKSIELNHVAACHYHIEEKILRQIN